MSKWKHLSPVNVCQKNTFSLPKAMWNHTFWADGTRVELFGYVKDDHHQGDAWGWQLHALGGSNDESSKHQSVWTQSLEASAEQLKTERNFTFQRDGDLKLKEGRASPKQDQGSGMVQGPDLNPVECRN